MLLQSTFSNSSRANAHEPPPLHPTIASWRDALARLQHDASPHGWRRLRDEAIQMGCPPALWSSLYSRTILQRGIFQTALLAVLEEPHQHREHALAHIAEAAKLAATPPPRSPARLPGDFEHRLALADALSSPRDAIDLCIGIARTFGETAQARTTGATDASLDAARNAARAGKHADLLRHAAHAGAFAMRGDVMWDGWLREGPAEFQACCTLLVTCMDWIHFMQLTPDLSHDAVLAAASDRHGESHRAAHPARALAPLGLEHLLVELSAIVRNGGLTPDHSAAHDAARRTQLCEGVLALCHARAELDAFGPPHSTQHDAEDEREDEQIRAAMAQLEADCIVALGHLRYDTSDAMNTLLHRAVDPDLHPAIGEAAVWALQQIGAASLPVARATMRFASDPYARHQARLIFGGAGRNNPAAFDELAAQFNAAGWQDGRADLALPLALTEDPRCATLLIAALRQSPESASDVSSILEALDWLDIAWRWITEIDGIELPDFTRIANLPGSSTPPIR